MHNINRDYQYIFYIVVSIVNILFSIYFDIYKNLFIYKYNIKYIYVLTLIYSTYTIMLK